MSTTTTASANPEVTEDDIDLHIAAVFDTVGQATHDIRLTCACGRVAFLPVGGVGMDAERPWVCPLCCPTFEQDLCAWRVRACHR